MDRRYQERINLTKETIEKNITEEKFTVLLRAASSVFDVIKDGGLVITTGNGGAYATAEHLSAELNLRLDVNRSIRTPCVTIGAESSSFSAAVNDSLDVDNRLIDLVYPFSKINCKKALILFTTSLHSNAILNLYNYSLAIPSVTNEIIIFCGEDRNEIASLTFAGTKNIISVDSPSEVRLPTEMIQEVQTIYMHTFCDMLYTEIEEARKL